MNNTNNSISVVTNGNIKQKSLLIASCCLVLFMTCSSLWFLNNTYHITNIINDEYESDTAKLSNQFTTHNPHCNNESVYLISRWAVPLSRNTLSLYRKIQQFGFNLKCNFEERKKLGLQPVPPITWRSENCFKYNNIIKKKKKFCNGAKLIYLNNFYDSFRMQTLNIETKTSLNEILTIFCNRYHSNDNVCNFLLLSYNLNIRNERTKFLTNHIDCNNNKPQYDKTWVFKEHIEFGSGVHPINNHQEIYRLITANISENINNCTFNPIKNKTYFEQEGIINYYKINDGYVINRTKCLIQEFVDNPLLVKLEPNETIKHVFHLRSFLLVPSYSNPLIVLHWPRPVLLINPNEYNNKQKHLNKESILTNRDVVQHDDIVDDSYAWIWGRTQFQNYLNQEYEYNLFGDNYTVNKLNNDIKHIAQTVFNANSYKNKLKKQQIFENENEFQFDIWCMDIIINDQFELKLMEMNSRCGHPCEPEKIKKKAISGGYDWDCHLYFSEAAKIVMELSIKKTFNRSIEKIDSLRNYEIVFWE